MVLGLSHMGPETTHAFSALDYTSQVVYLSRTHDLLFSVPAAADIATHSNNIVVHVQ